MTIEPEPGRSTMRFCSSCGGSIELQRPPGDTALRHVCRSCGTVHYRNPRVVVGTVASLDQRVLLCRRAIEPRRGYWTIPAGYLEVGESAEDGARREAWEEARAELGELSLLAVYDVVLIEQVQILYRAELASATVAAGEETEELDLFPWHEVPWAELAFPTVRWVLERAISLRDRPPPYEVAGNPGAMDPPDLAAPGSRSASSASRTGNNPL